MSEIFFKRKSTIAEPVGDINWNQFRTDFVKLACGVAKQLKLTNWAAGNWFNMPGLQFDVIAEDGIPKNRVFRTTSKRLIRRLKPIIQNAQAQSKSTIWVSITRMGEGLNTTYEVREHR